MENNLYLGQSANGKGVFVARRFRKREGVINFNGKTFTLEQLPFPYEKVEDHYVQIGKKLYMGPSGGLDDFINHSCEPNSGLIIAESKVTLIAIRIL